MATALQVMRLPATVDIVAWDDVLIRRFVSVFQALRFPTLLFLNKVDAPAGGATDRNIARLCKMFSSAVCYTGSAAAECFLRSSAGQGLVEYAHPGGEFPLTAAGAANQTVAGKVTKAEERLLQCFGGTGVWSGVQVAVDMTQPVVVFPVTTLPPVPAQCSRPMQQTNAAG
jgi:ribosome-binding ATPase YchF (GTP1/OBG family)